MRWVFRSSRQPIGFREKREGACKCCLMITQFPRSRLTCNVSSHKHYYLPAQPTSTSRTLVPAFALPFGIALTVNMPDCVKSVELQWTPPEAFSGVLVVASRFFLSMASFRVPSTREYVRVRRTTSVLQEADVVPLPELIPTGRTSWR